VIVNFEKLEEVDMKRQWNKKYQKEQKIRINEEKNLTYPTVTYLIIF